MYMQPRLEIRHLLMLVTIAQAGTVTRAAELIGVTQSALTHRIKEAERRLDVVLFTRVGRRLRMTPAGETLYQTATRVLDELQRAEWHARETSGGVEHIVRIGIGAYTRYHWLPGFLEGLRWSAPELQLEVVAEAMRRPLALLADGDIDVAIVAGENSRAEFETIHLFADELVAITPPLHPWTRQPFVEAQAFGGETYITYSFTQQSGFEAERFLRPANATPARLVRVELPEAIVELVRAGLGVSVLSRWAIEPYLRAGTLAATQLSAQGLNIDWYALYRKADGHGSPAHKLASALSTWCDMPNGGFHSIGEAH